MTTLHWSELQCPPGQPHGLAPDAGPGDAPFLHVDVEVNIGRSSNFYALLDEDWVVTIGDRVEMMDRASKCCNGGPDRRILGDAHVR